MPKALDEVAGTGAQVADNVRALRKTRGVTLEALSARLTELGRPIPIASLSKLEKRARRVDVDDLIALAIALDVSPVRLLLPGEPAEDRKVDLVPNERSDWQAAWRWATGDQPLLATEELELTDPRVVEYIHENRPYELRRNLVTEVARFLLARALGGPFHAEFRYDGRKLTKATLTYDSGDD
jgi:transcriptional regulator with XRE-family HTH domain